jgi:gamma-glutamyltranspeptidase/glutathione hydrolase
MRLVKARGKTKKPNPKDLYVQGQCVVSSSHPMATDAGLAMLHKGGNAADAYIAAAAMQTVVEPTMTTLSGIFGLSYFDAKKKQLRAIGCSWASPDAEDGRISPGEAWGGRTVMLPSWVNAAQATSERVGRLPWKDVLAPAIEAAHEGFPIDEFLWGWMFESRAMIARDPEARAVWQPDGWLLTVGDRVRQPAAARTLERVATDGSEYFYRGEFAHRFVNKIRSLGSRMTLDDLARHEQAINDYVPDRMGRYRDYDVYGAGGCFGPGEGISSAIAMNLVEAGNLRARGKSPAESAELTYLLMRIVEESWNAGFSYRPESREVLASKEYAEQLWRVVESAPARSCPSLYAETDGLVVVDAEGNVAVGCHSSSSVPFGAGIVVDGVFANRVMFLHRPLPAGFTSSHIIMKNGVPVLAMASPSGSVFPTLIQNTTNVLEFGMTLEKSVWQPRFGVAYQNTGAAMIEVSYPEEVLKGLTNRGMPHVPISAWEPHLGSCHAAYIEPITGIVHGVADPRRLGVASGW